MLKRRLVIIGAGGHGKVVADIALKNGYENVVFVDSSISGSSMGIPIIGDLSEIEKLVDDNTRFIVAIGDNSVRKRITNDYNLPWETLIHPSAQIGGSVSVGAGSVIAAGAVINSSATVGAHCIVNTAAVVEHDDTICDFVHISPGAVLGGNVKIGECSHIGIGAVLRNNISICENCTVGAGAVVVKDIFREGVYIGVPARLLSDAEKDDERK